MVLWGESGVFFPLCNDAWAGRWGDAGRMCACQMDSGLANNLRSSHVRWGRSLMRMGYPIIQFTRGDVGVDMVAGAKREFPSCPRTMVENSYTTSPNSQAVCFFWFIFQQHLGESTLQPGRANVAEKEAERKSGFTESTIPMPRDHVVRRVGYYTLSTHI